MSEPNHHEPINPAIGAMLRSARDFLAHEHSLFRSLDLQPVLIGKGKATFSMRLPADFCDEAGAIHPGLYTIILDSIFGLAVFTALDEIKPIATINLRSDYVSCINAGQWAVCAAECEAVAGDIAHVSGRLVAKSDGRLLATGAGSFMVGTKGPIKGMRL